MYEKLQTKPGIPVEKLKRPDEIGKYIYPEGCGKMLPA